MPSDTLSFSQMIKTDPDSVYRAFTNATALRGWLCNVATAVPRPGGRLYMWWESGFYTSGEFKSVEPGKKVVFTWSGKRDPSPTEVEVTFSPREEGTLVKVDHKGLGRSAQWESIRSEIKKGWENALTNLNSVITTGKDLRFVNRPMLGIIVDDLNEEIAEQLGLPSAQGIRLGGTVAGMGAEAAGLQENDVLISMGGMPTVDFENLNQALNTHKAGDTIEVIFFRDGKQENVHMTLSGRPIPEIPATAKGLADAVANIYQGIETELDKFLSEVSEEEASFKPAPGEWSIKGVLAHFIHGERGYQEYMAELVGGHERFADDYAGNIDEYIEATITAFSSVDALFNEYKLNMSETLHFLANLPDKFVAQKGEYWRLAYGLLQDPYHFNTHLEQMQSALEAARMK
ncbi:MAG: SRPBCC domain-containing protein [Anaerolineales bacterium]